MTQRKKDKADRKKSEKAVRNDSQQKEVQEFKMHMLSNKMSKHTIDNYVRFIRQLLEWAGKAPGQITQEDLERYKTHMSIEKHYSKSTMYIHIKGIQAFFSFVKSDVAKNITPPKRPDSLPKYLSEDEMAKIFETAKRDNPDDLRDMAILTVLGYTGLRVSELCNLNIEDIDFNEKTIKVRSGKGDKDRIVIFEENTEEALKRHLADRRRAISKDEPSAIFVGQNGMRIGPRAVELIVKKIAKKAGIQKQVTPHVFRHTMATTLLKRGADIRIIQQLLGHSSIATTQIYTHVDEEMLKKAYTKAKPKYE